MTTSLHDPNVIPHATVHLSNKALRSEEVWYTLHFWPGSGSVYLPRPDNRPAYENKVTRRRAREHRKREWQRIRDEQQTESELHAGGVSEAGNLPGPTSQEAHVASTGGGRPGVVVMAEVVVQVVADSEGGSGPMSKKHFLIQSRIMYIFCPWVKLWTRKYYLAGWREEKRTNNGKSRTAF